MTSRVPLGLCSLVLFATLIANTAKGQRFVEQGFQPYSVRNAPESVEKSIRKFLDDRIKAGEQIEIISDSRGGRILGSRARRDPENL